MQRRSDCLLLPGCVARRVASAQNQAMRIVYHAENIIDANLVKGVLAMERIVAFVAGEHLTGAIGELPARDLVSVMVADSDLERALPIVQAIDADLRERREDPGDYVGEWSPV